MVRARISEGPIDAADPCLWLWDYHRRWHGRSAKVL